ncbi:Tol-Pal system beta propeller repeat protein TolB [Candidatus Profftia sp. (ex Adelges kitamiensis)]|uniref:Tol-Pal system beta propeller repeat protein TolB n=1 Tax=Candidatus Profftia sp. (ex Adelges kitamiensis) TaxID=2864218 RepID=UPI001CE33738|nr:Tol-Pal system beta propeller repeat protein TolB [Candidatus Profftia sp. (ex Adelges kitamiensis)]
MKQAFIITIGLLSLWWGSMLHAEIKIVITHGINTARPIVVIPFKWTGLGPAPEDIGKIIAADLRNSGKFNPINTKRIPQKPITVNEVIPADWTSLGIEAIVLGQVHPSSDGYYIVNYNMIDISNNSRRIISQNQYKVNRQCLRYAAHNSSNEVFEKLTGIKGAFRTRIAYVVHNNNNQFPYELCIADYDGYNPLIIHRSMQPLMSPTWSPDGKKLAYVTFESGQSVLIIQTLSDGNISRVAAFPRHNGAPSFSPDGKKIAFALSKTGNLNLYVMELSSGSMRQVTEDRSNNTEPSWFPDSKTLAFTSDQCGRPQIYKVNINNGEYERLTWYGIRNQNGNVSYDGKFLVMVSTNEGAQHITKLNITSNTRQVLTSTFLDETPSISPNGTMVIYSATEGLNSVLRLVSTDGHFRAHLPAANSQVKFPAWSPYL